MFDDDNQDALFTTHSPRFNHQVTLGFRTIDPGGYQNPSFFLGKYPLGIVFGSKRLINHTFVLVLEREVFRLDQGVHALDHSMNPRCKRGPV